MATRLLLRKFRVLSAISAMPNINTTQSAVKCQANQAEKSELPYCCLSLAIN